MTPRLIFIAMVILAGMVLASLVLQIANLLQ